MATARIALGSIMDTVSQTANSVSALVNTTTKGIGMLDAFVTKAANEQKKQHIRAGLTFDEHLKIDFAREVTTLKTDADEFCNKSTRHKELFNEAYAQLEQALNPKSPE